MAKVFPNFPKIKLVNFKNYLKLKFTETQALKIIQELELEEI
jgi:hypothetical protein